MNSITEQIWQTKPPFGLFTSEMINNLYPSLSSGARKALLFRATSKKEIIRFKPGYYSLDKKYTTENPHPFILASFLHSPSFISTEAALRYFGLIPEAVYTTESISPLRQQTISTEFGNYYYSHVSCKQFLVGVKNIKLNSFWVYVASPLRALVDMVYLRKSLFQIGDTLDFLYASLRIEKKSLEQIDYRNFVDIYNSFTNRRVLYFLNLLKDEFIYD